MKKKLLDTPCFIELGDDNEDKWQRFLNYFIQKIKNTNEKDTNTNKAFQDAIGIGLDSLKEYINKSKIKNKLNIANMIKTLAETEKISSEKKYIDSKRIAQDIQNETNKLKLKILQKKYKNCLILKKQ